MTVRAASLARFLSTPRAVARRVALCFPLAGFCMTPATRAADSANPNYHETYRPQFHFTAIKDWINDPNGMVYYQGEYHLFFQRTPGSLESGKKVWGHAVSGDMLHWRQLNDAIELDERGDIWSGSAVVDWNNTAGFQTGSEKPIVAMYTAGGISQCLSFSNDRGRTWTKYPGNPVLPHINAQNRDPKVIWYEPARTWVMALYLDRGNDYALFTSPNLKQWKQIQTVPLAGASECPDFFPLPLDDDPNKTTWIFTGANGRYLLGSFDGNTFVPDGPPHTVEYGPNCYAGQTFSDIPESDGRRIQICWMNGGQYPQMPFNQQMTIPCVLTLRSTPQGPRLFKYPVAEVDTLRDRSRRWNQATFSPDQDPLAGLTGELLDISADFRLPASGKIVFDIRGAQIEYDCATHVLTNGKPAPIPSPNDYLKLRILVDRTSIETFANDGVVSISRCFVPDQADRSIRLTISGKPVVVDDLQIWQMHSVWEGGQ